jgi:hypothetical protein
VVLKVKDYINEVCKTNDFSNKQSRSRIQRLSIYGCYKLSTNTNNQCDIDYYFKSPVVEWDGNNDPGFVINWWRVHQAEYPIMSRVAQDILSIPALEVDAERLFSSGRDLIGLRRYSLSAKMLRLLVLLRSHLQERG